MNSKSYQRIFTLFLIYFLSQVHAFGQAPNYKFIGGNWFNGESFDEMTVFSSDGMLQFMEPTQVDSVIDLAGAYVIPPFGEAHTHLLSQPGEIENQHAMFLKAGVFYAMNQDPIFLPDQNVLNFANQAQSVDVIYTQGVITASWNIIAGLYQMFGEQGIFGETYTLDELDTKNLFLIDDQNDLEEKWGLLEENNADFIKIIIAFTEEQELRKNNPERYSFELGSYSKTPGINPHLLPEIVERAHKSGLRTSVHVETAADFRLAVESGTNFIAHIPASWQVGEEKTGVKELESWLISEEDAQKATDKNIKVITTAYPPPDTMNVETYAKVHKANLTLLKEKGVSIILGSDLFDKTIVAEALYISELGVFTNQALLNMLTYETPRAIFPNRKIGRLKENFEASFLVLERNPLNDLTNIDSIKLRVKQGHLLTIN